MSKKSILHPGVPVGFVKNVSYGQLKLTYTYKNLRKRFKQEKNLLFFILIFVD